MIETIGNRISKYRKAKGMTQEELASKLGVSSQAVSKWENDISCPDISLLPQLCSLLDVTADELLTGKANEVKLVPREQRKSMEDLALRIRVKAHDGDNVKINVPFTLLKVCMEMGVDMTASVGGNDAIRSVDMNKIVALVEQGVIGKLMEVETSDGDIVEIVVE